MSLTAEDKIAIHELITELYKRIDAEDAAGVAADFTDDGVFRAPYGDFKGHAEVQKFMESHIAAGREDGMRHFVTNLSVEPAGTDAVVKFYILKLKVATGPSFVATADGTFQVKKTAKGGRLPNSPSTSTNRRNNRAGGGRPVIFRGPVAPKRRSAAAITAPSCRAFCCRQGAGAAIRSRLPPLQPFGKRIVGPRGGRYHSQPWLLALARKGTARCIGRDCPFVTGRIGMARMDEVGDIVPKTKWEPYLEAELGFRNHWYPAFFGGELGEADRSAGLGEPVAQVRSEVILGERILFRRINGVVRAIADQCLHKGVPLSRKPECYAAGTITCWYHGFTYDMSSGLVVDIVSDPESRLIGKTRIKTYPVEERQGLVFVFIGDIDPPALANDLQPGFLDPDLSVYPEGWSKLVNCNWRLGAENGFDPAHTYMHRNSPLVRGFKVPTTLGDANLSDKQGMEIIDGPGPKGVRLRRGVGRPIWETKIAGSETISARYKPGEPGALEGMVPDVSIWMPCGLKVDPFPAPRLLHFEWYVPVTARTHRYIITWGSYAKDDQARKIFHDEVKYLWKEFVPNKFTNEDMFAREAMDEFYSEQDGWRREFLFGPDIVTTTWRRLCSAQHRGIQKLPYRRPDR